MQPVICKPQTAPCAIPEDLNDTCNTNIKNGVWEPTQFNDYGTSVVPVVKLLLQGQQKAKLQVCGDNLVTVNQHLVAN